MYTPVARREIHDHFSYEDLSHEKCSIDIYTYYAVPTFFPVRLCSVRLVIAAGDRVTIDTTIDNAEAKTFANAYHPEKTTVTEMLTFCTENGTSVSISMMATTYRGNPKESERRLVIEANDREYFEAIFDDKSMIVLHSNFGTLAIKLMTPK